jgi:hypothetical protein
MSSSSKATVVILGIIAVPSTVVGMFMFLGGLLAGVLKVVGNGNSWSGTDKLIWIGGGALLLVIAWSATRIARSLQHDAEAPNSY